MADIQGLDALKYRLTKSGKTVTVVTSQALMDAADEVIKSARFMVPKQSGRLADTIRKSDIMRSRKKGNPMVEISAGDQTTLVGPKKQFQLAMIKEYGTTRQPAEPFMHPAMRLNKAKVRSLIRKAMRIAIKEANGSNTI